VNGDGVEDIVVAGPDNLRIFAGIAERP
jgi:hypothetical protein